MIRNLPRAGDTTPYSGWTRPDRWAICPYGGRPMSWGGTRS